MSRSNQNKSDVQQEGNATPPDRRAVKRAKKFLAEVRKLLRKHEKRVSEKERGKLEDALAAVEASMAGDARAKPLATAIKELDARVDRCLGFAKKSAAREYAESIAIAVLIAVVLRAFVVEAFKIPTGSMIPTLLVGDHIFVNKFIYGLRVPLTNAWLVHWDIPGRGDVIVFRYPRDLSKDYIKRVVALPGDRIRVQGRRVFINGKLLERAEGAPFTYIQEGDEEPGAMFGAVRHALAFPETSADSDQQYTVIYERGGLSFPTGQRLPGVECSLDPVNPECTVQEGYVFVMGDNRDNSSDSRVWGGVPMSYIKGQAMFIWWSRGPKSGARWSRIGSVVR